MVPSQVEESIVLLVGNIFFIGRVGFVSAEADFEDTVTIKDDATVISAQDSSDATASATFESTGLSFDTDQAAIYFGASKNFRIKYSDGVGGPSVLQIQSYDSSALDYVTRQEFSDST